jgi:hypothetical protein
VSGGPLDESLGAGAHTGGDVHRDAPAQETHVGVLEAREHDIR